MIKLWHILCLLMMSCTATLFATHNRAGEITYIQLNNNTIQATITTYTKTSSIDADRDELEIAWGDGSVEILMRNEEIFLPNDIKINRYISNHTYANANGTSFRLSMTDPNRTDEIVNISGGNSVDIPFHLETIVYFRNPNIFGLNNTPTLLQPPIDNAFIGQPFIHNPNAFDPDGDSLAYELIVPLQSTNNPVPLYQFPNQVRPGPNNQVTLNPLTGDFLWKSPQLVGEYNVAILIKEYRNGILLSQVVRDLQITVKNGQNTPPILEVLLDTCIVAGNSLNIEVLGDDIDAGQRVLMTASGGPLAIDNQPATFNAPVGYQNPAITGTFEWNTNCSHIREAYYQVVFRVVDDFDGQGLATLKTLQIKVVAPPPVIQSLETNNNGQLLRWEAPYDCELEEKFTGFSIYRKEGSSNIPLDTCNPGLAGKGYELIAQNVQDIDNLSYFYTDTDNLEGASYCYRVVANYRENFPDAVTFESLASEELCFLINKDLPLITNVDILSTNSTNGEILVRWQLPGIPALDTLLFQGPYRFKIKRIVNGLTTTIATKVFENFDDIISDSDTTFTDNGLNTTDNIYNYTITLFDDVDSLGTSASASSVRATTSASNQQIRLNYSATVPWSNFEYDIYRTNDAGTFDLITTTTATSYLDTNLINGKEYCYYVDAYGTYGVDNVQSPLINTSNITCNTPFDNEAPCIPTFTVGNVAVNCATNQVSISIPSISSECPENGITYSLYFLKPNATSPELLTTFTDMSLSFEYDLASKEDVLGCFYITASDIVGNESEASQVICGESCPQYALPNTFTPNNDGDNDLFIPYPYEFVERIALKIFNEWGTSIFETNDPDILWDGKIQNGGDAVTGVYFYHCDVFVRTSKGIEQQNPPLSGYIHLIR